MTQNSRSPSAAFIMEIGQMIRGRLTFLVIKTKERGPDLSSQLQELAAQQGRNFMHYSATSGLSMWDRQNRTWVIILGPEATFDQVAQALRMQQQPYLIHMEQIHSWWSGPIINALRQLVVNMSQTRNVIVGSIPLTGDVKVPSELDSYCTVLKQPLPQPEDHKSLIRTVEERSQWLMTELVNRGMWEQHREEIARALSGLTRAQALDAFRFSMVAAMDEYPHPTHWNSQEVYSYIAKRIEDWKAERALEAGRIRRVDISGHYIIPGFERLYERLKRYADAGRYQQNDEMSFTGIALIGPPGNGKTRTASGIAKFLGWPLYQIVSVHMSGEGIVGSMEHAFDAAFSDAKMLTAGGRNVVLLIDELEKLVSGTEAGGRSDGGGINRAFGILLHFLEEAASAGILVVATLNSASVPLETLRSGRLMVVPVDVPDRNTRIASAKTLLREWLRMSQNKYGQQPILDSDVTPEFIADLTEGWVGSEIRELIFEASSHGQDRRLSRGFLLMAKDDIVPMVLSMPGEMAAYRQQAERFKSPRERSSAASTQTNIPVTPPPPPVPAPLLDEGVTNHPAEIKKQSVQSEQPKKSAAAQRELERRRKRYQFPTS